MGDPGTQMIIKGAMMAASMAMTMSQKFEGPRLDDLSVTTADYGTSLSYFWGKRRLEGRPIIWAEKLREKKTTSKTKGGKYAEYKYFGTFAVVIADHEIDSVSRIWMDKHLVYDVTRAGPISPLIGFFSGVGSDAPVKITNGRNMRIYTGTETQEPDPRMEAWCEDRYGPDSCPAYRGVSYIVFQDLPLEKFGNRIPQVTVEAINDVSPSLLYETIDAGASVGPVFSKDFSRFIYYNFVGNAYSIWDTATLTNLLDGTLPVNGEWLAYDSAGYLWGTGGTLGSKLRMFSGDGFSLLAEVDVGTQSDYVYPIGGDVYLRTYDNTGNVIIQCNSTECSLTEIDYSPSMYFADLDGNAWTIGMVGTTVHLRHIETGDELTFASPGGATGYHSAFVNANGDFFVVIDTTACIIEQGTAVILDTASIGGSAAEHYEVMGFVQPGAANFYTQTQEIDAITLATKQTYNLSDWTGTNTDLVAYEPITHSLFCGALTVRCLNRIGSNGTDLADVIQDVSDRCGVVELDVSGLTQTVSGYSTVQGAGKDWIAPLLDIHDVDARPHNFAVQFLTRGSSAAGTIPVTEFVREGDEARYQITIKQDTDLPRRVALSFADANKDQQKNTVLSQRPLAGTDGDRELTIDLSTYVATPEDAQRFSDRYFRRKWNGREGVTNGLTAQYLGIEPGDVWNLQLDDVTQSHKLIKATISQGRINTEWERDFPGLASLGTGEGAEMEGRDDDVIYVPSQTKGFVLDIPLTQDSHDATAPQLYYAAGSYGGDWPGATLYQVDGSELNPWNGIDSSDRATWGYATDALGAPSSPWVWDRANTVNIKTFGTLTSSTEAAINANPSINRAYLGGELINFATATLEGDGSYTLSNLRRGRRGTEWACDGHAAGDEFVLVEDLSREAMGLSSVGLSMEYRAQTIGRDASATTPIDVDFTGATLKPYAPANLAAERDFTSGDWTITGVRRTRLGGDWVGGTSIPLSEASEAYDILIVDGSGTEIRELTATIDGDGNFSATYTSSQQSTDFGSAQSTINIVAYQLSDAVGRGFPATLQATESGDILSSTITASAPVAANNASVTPTNPSHGVGDTLLCIAVVNGTAATLACATSGWTAADGITNPTTLNGSRMWLFQNECATNEEDDPVITTSGGSSGNTVAAVVLRIPSRDVSANFTLGTVSANASSGQIAFAQNSPSIDDGNAIIAIGYHGNNYISGGGPGVITGITAGLDWTEIVDFGTPLGSDMTLTVDYAINDSGSAYTAGTSGVKSPTYSVGEPSAGVYLEVPLL